MSKSQRKRREQVRKWIMRLVLLAVLAVAVYVTVKSLPKLKSEAPAPSGTTASTNNSGGSAAGNSGSKTQTGNSGSASQTSNQSTSGGKVSDGTSQSGAGGTAQEGNTSSGTEEPNTNTVTTPADPRATFIICIDPGHGYADPGCLCDLEEGQGLQEKDITLPISLRLRDKLEAMGYTVVMTREDDVYPDWLREQRQAEGKTLEKMDGYTRCDIANEAEAFLFVSVHVDKAQNAKAHGVRMYYYTDNTPTTAEYAKMLAAGVNDAFMEQVQTVGLSWEDAYIMNKYVSMPSVLIEVGFFSNAEDTLRMQDEVWQSTLAQGIADGIEKYWQKYGVS